MTWIALPEGQEPLCPWETCKAGMGMAGNHSCYLKGDALDPNCPKWERDYDDPGGGDDNTGEPYIEKERLSA